MRLAFIRWGALALAFLIALAALLLANPRPKTPGAEPEAQPALRLSAGELDFGKMLPSDAPEKKLTVTNSTGRALVVLDVATSCSCTKARMSTAALGPGERAELTVRLHISDYPVNTVDTRVHILYADPGQEGRQEDLVVPVHGSIVPEYVADPNHVDFGRVKQATQSTQTVVIRQNGPAPLKILKVEAPVGFVASLRDPAPARGLDSHDSSGKSPTEFTVEVSPARDARQGHLSGKVTVITNIERIPKLEIPVSAVVYGIECTIEPKVVVFGPAKPGARIGDLQVNGVEELRVTRLSDAKGVLTFEPPVVQTPGTSVVAIRVSPNAPEGDLAGRISLSLQEGPLSEVRTIAYFGTVTAGAP